MMLALDVGEGKREVADDRTPSSSMMIEFWTLGTGMLMDGHRKTVV